MTARALHTVPPPEELVRLAAPKFPSLVELLVKFIDGNHRDLEWYLVRLLLEKLDPIFPHIRGAKTLRQWGAEIAPKVSLKEPPTPQDLSLETRAFRIEHPALPKGRYYFLLGGNPEYPVTFLDPAAPELDGAHLFRRWHIATLNIGTLFPPRIVRVVYDIFSIALLSTEAYVMSDVERSFVDFGRDLRTLFTARGMKW